MAMRMEMGLQQRLELKMKLAPQIIQSIEILQLPMLELQQRIKQELVENPVLEELELKPDVSEAEPAEAEPAASKEDNAIEEMADLAKHWEEYSDSSRPRPVREEKDKKHEAMQNTAARPETLQDFLFNQISLFDITPQQKLIGKNIIYNIDDNGYLQSSLPELAAASSGAELEDVEAVLALVQSLDPPGVGARDVKECLLSQLTDPDKRTLEKELLENHLEDIHMNRIPKIMRDTSRTAEEIQAALDYIRRHLNPRPGNVFGGEQPQYITPDIIVEEVDGTYEVRLLDTHLPQLYISPLYHRMLNDSSTSEQAKEFIRRKIQAARWLIDSIEQRRNTLKKIADDVIRIQQPFLDQGISALQPLKMRTIAAATGVHVSTVSRAISDKYIQTPRGIFPLKFFFSGGTRNVEGTMTSRKSIKQLVIDVIENEDKTDPFSDDDVAKKLQAEGIDIARRTVTKYRKGLKIPSSRRRKSYLSGTKTAN
ncbi:MAG: RNA polymerase factor sigma-54 [Planctomycetes bacterium]|nr:RNA polymerase factor sigma-54 [Planctomycetota bacterium]